MTRLVFDLFVASVLLFEHQQKNCLLADIFPGLDGVTKYGSG